jgi:hypothetical protein
MTTAFQTCDCAAEYGIDYVRHQKGCASLAWPPEPPPAAPRVPPIDWSVFHGPKPIVECQCGTVYRSHVKGVVLGTMHDTHRKFTVVSQEPCPACHRTLEHVRSARYERIAERIDRMNTFNK